MKLWLDDIRPTPDGWLRAYTAYDAINILKNHDIDEISLDHDLGDEAITGTGYDVLLWIEENVFMHNYIPPIMHAHSSNPSARQKMELTINSINKRANKT